MEQQELHREEHLEAEIRRLRQCLRNLSESVIAGEDDAVPLSLAARNLLNE